MFSMFSVFSMFFKLTSDVLPSRMAGFHNLWSPAARMICCQKLYGLLGTILIWGSKLANWIVFCRHWTKKYIWSEEEMVVQWKMSSKMENGAKKSKSLLNPVCQAVVGCSDLETFSRQGRDRFSRAGHGFTTIRATWETKKYKQSLATIKIQSLATIKRQSWATIKRQSYATIKTTKRDFTS